MGNASFFHVCDCVQEFLVSPATERPKRSLRMKRVFLQNRYHFGWFKPYFGWLVYENRGTPNVYGVRTSCSPLKRPFDGRPNFKTNQNIISNWMCIYKYIHTITHT